MRIGSLIRQIADEKKISIDTLALRLDMTRANIYKIFERDTIQTELLCKISLSLEYNFFIHLQTEIDNQLGKSPQDINVNLTISRSKLKDLIIEINGLNQKDSSK